MLISILFFILCKMFGGIDDMHNFIKIKIYKENIYTGKVLIGCIHFFNNEDFHNNLKKELLYLEKEYGKISDE